MGAAYTAADATITLDNANTLWKRGDVIEFDDGLQLVASADGTGGTVALAAAPWRGTDANQADNEIVRRNPQFAYLDISDAIDEVIRGHLWPHVWTWHNDSLTWSSTDTTYDLDNYVEDVVRMYQYNLTSDGGFHPIPNTWYSVERVVNSAVATNGGLLRVRRVHDESAIVYYEGKRRPDVADLANFDTRLDDLIVHGATALMDEGSLSSEQVDRSRRANRSDGKAASDSRVHSARFFTLREQVKADLRSEIRQERQPVPLRRRRY